LPYAEKDRQVVGVPDALIVGAANRLFDR
jgi:hypothetical protein